MFNVYLLSQKFLIIVLFCAILVDYGIGARYKLDTIDPVKCLIAHIEGVCIMAFLNQQEREQLAAQLRNMDFNKAKNKLLRMDPKGRLAYFRNSQRPDTYHTRFELSGLGTRVTLVERRFVDEQNGKLHSRFVLEDVIVEPTPDNRL